MYLHLKQDQRDVLALYVNNGEGNGFSASFSDRGKSGFPSSMSAMIHPGVSSLTSHLQPRYKKSHLHINN